MTVGDLKAMLADQPDHLIVMMANDEDYSLAEVTELKRLFASKFIRRPVGMLHSAVELVYPTGKHHPFDCDTPNGMLEALVLE